MMPPIEELRRDFIAVDRTVPVVDWKPGALTHLGPSIAVIGAFDGVHLGHRSLIAAATEEAGDRGMASVAVTFMPDPDEVVAPRPDPKLCMSDDRLALLASSGVDAVLVIPFTVELSKLDHAEFFQRVLLPACDIRSIHVGADFRLGHHGASTVPVMGEWCASEGISLTGHELMAIDGEVVSSTHIREHLAAGCLERSEQLLGRRYLLRGTVDPGRGEGTGMGFPTANVTYAAHVQVPAEGVYGGLALVDGTVWPAAINVGKPPTFRDRAASASLEANIIGFAGDIYGAAISLVFLWRIRPLVQFPSVDALIATVLGNIDEVRTELGESGVSLHDFR